MKHIISILSVTIVTLFGVNLNSLTEINKPLPSEMPKASVESKTRLDKCPAGQQYTAEFDIDLVYKHCHTCGYGVFLDHDDGHTKCTYCGVKETYKH